MVNDGFAGIMVGYPLDTIKVHMQTQDYRKPKYRGNWDCFRTILAKESVAGLYRGISSPMAGVALVNAVIFGVYGETRRHIPDPNSLSSCFVSGALAGLAQSPICSPIELAKTRMQLRTSSSGTQFSGPMDCLRYTYKHEGYRGVFRGLNVTLLREIPSYGTYFLTYEILTRTPDNAPVSTAYMLLAGGLAGTASWTVSYPLDLVKSRIQADGRRYAGLVDCLRQTVTNEGYSCLYRGLSSTIIRAFPTNAVTLTVVTWIFRLFGQDNDSVTATNQGEKVVKTMESVGEISETREPFLEKWNNFLTSMPERMAIHRLPYSASTDELKLERLVNKENERRTKEEVKHGREEGEKRRVSREDVENLEELCEKKVERTVAKTVNTVSMALA
ncbi:Mitochondrial carnitine/acylcarnitine carrier protein CACL [Melipona quadrifasciata]|uniref:Mitochondrial basic amino acids transporter n=1 Tax=Melipona quadrifasciata TaxID=166423 RepID=A0A0N0BID8_9HYME|nr:Mitochondrial carnitine/acylcarnitine carrier protein CACL [Melipona quadrifasciata]